METDQTLNTSLLNEIIVDDKKRDSFSKNSRSTSIREPNFNEDKKELPKMIEVRLDNEDIRSQTSETPSDGMGTVRGKIIKELVVPNYYNDVKSTIKGRSKYRKAANYAELLSKLLTTSATVLAFSAGAYPDQSYLSFIAGCTGAVAMACLSLSSYFKSEEKERTQQANQILKVLHIDSIPELEHAD